jgi:NADPH:quinone reductase-like Zn-dependent oxidoreductase
VEDADPRPGPGEVRVRVLASGVSFTDALIRAGTYFGGPKPPFTPGYELVGVIEELGPGCSRLRRPSSSESSPGCTSSGLHRLATAPPSSGSARWLIDYHNEDFLARVHELTAGRGVDVVLDGIGGAVSLRSFRVLRVGDQIKGDPGRRLILIGNYNTMVRGRKSWRGWLEW